MGTKKILACDDEPHILHVVTSKLSNAGFEVIAAEDGAEALALAREHLPDLIVSDYQMPELSGLEMAAQLMTRSDTSQIPVILLTARGMVLDDEAITSTRIVRVLSKPFSPRELLQCVTDQLAEGAASGG